MVVVESGVLPDNLRQVAEGIEELLHQYGARLEYAVVYSRHGERVELYQNQRRDDLSQIDAPDNFIPIQSLEERLMWARLEREECEP